MARKSYTIVSVSAEVDPYAKTGGLGDVARSLPKSLQRLGQNVIIFTPLYKQVTDLKKHKVKKIIDNTPIVIDSTTTIGASLYQAELAPKLPVYLISIERYFGRSKSLYGSEIDNARFYAFDVAVIEFMKLLNIKPDIIHCHDWHAGLIPELLKKRYKQETIFKHTTSVFTIHNLNFQLGHAWWEIPGVKRDNGRTALPLFTDSKKIERINFAKRAILSADAINTVSETYRNEILQQHLGQDLHRILQKREHKLFGVVNGIDYNEFNPIVDKNIKVRYDSNSLEKKYDNKKALQKKCNLEINDQLPIMVMSSRIAEQKGIDLLLPLIPYLLRKDIQIIILGDGDKKYIKNFEQIARDHSDHFCLLPYAEQPELETLLYAGGDMLLLPSRFEPCGTNQLKALRYGCVPIVREVGGLGETISNYDPQSNPKGIGFVFNAYNSYTLMFTIARALETYKYREIWKRIVLRGMKVSFSWDLPAAKYLKLFKLAIESKHKETTPS